MIDDESDLAPVDVSFDIAIVAVGYERRCRWVVEQEAITATVCLALEFGFLAVASYEENLTFFRNKGYKSVPGLGSDAVEFLASQIDRVKGDNRKIFVDVSSMSRGMIANVLLAIDLARRNGSIEVWASYAASKFSSDYNPGPIRKTEPIRRDLAGWSTRPEHPLGAVFGLGCEPGLVLGALQVLEPDKVWTFAPKGFDEAFSVECAAANSSIGDIFDTTEFEYDLSNPVITRGKFEALLNAVGDDFRLILVPFGPKMFAWLTMGTIILSGRREVGIWTFSSGEDARVLDREAEGPIVWHHQHLTKQEQELLQDA